MCVKVHIFDIHIYLQTKKVNMYTMRIIYIFTKLGTEMNIKV